MPYCDKCRHYPDPEGRGYCYMFYRKMEGFCAKFTRKKQRPRDPKGQLDSIVSLPTHLFASMLAFIMMGVDGEAKEQILKNIKACTNDDVKEILTETQKVLDELAS